MPFQEQWRGVADLLYTTAGGILRNVVAEDGTTCRICRAPVDKYHYCYSCDQHRRSGLPLADRVGFLTYAAKGSQAYQIMYGYKSARPLDQHRLLVQLMLGMGALVHSTCLARVTRHPVDRWAVVPSTKVLPNVHPLRRLITPMIGLPSECTLAIGHPNSRCLDPGSFMAVEPLHGEHVLVIDDSWVTGAYAQSAAVALKQAGAERVSVFVPARILDSAFSVTKTFLADHPAGDFDAARCPWTFGECP